MIRSFFFLALFMIISSCSSLNESERGVASIDSHEMGLMCGTRELSSFSQGQHFNVLEVGEVTPLINTVDGSAMMESSMFMTKNGRRITLANTYPPVAQVIVEDRSIKSIRIRYTESKSDQTFRYSDEVNQDEHTLAEDNRVIKSSTLIRLNGKIYDFFCWFVAPAERF